MTRDELREKAARALREAPMRPVIKAGQIHSNVPITDGEYLRADAVLRVALKAAADRCAEFETVNNRTSPYEAGVRFAAGLMAGEIRALMPEDAS